MICGMLHLKRPYVWMMTIAATVLGTAGPALAALPAKPGPIKDAPAPYMAYLIAAVLTGAVVAASLMSSRRTHLD